MRIVYRTLRISKHTEQLQIQTELDDMGEKGFKLAATVPGLEADLLIFQKEVPDSPQPLNG